MPASWRGWRLRRLTLGALETGPIPTSIAIVSLLQLTTHLCLGIWIGWKIGAVRAGSAAVRMQGGRVRPTSDPAIIFQDNSAAIEDLRRRFQQLSTALSADKSHISDALVAAVARLVEATAALHRQVRVRGAATDATQPRLAGLSSTSTPPTVQAAVDLHEQQAGLTTAELECLTRNASDGKDTMQRRFAYSARQHVAPYVEDRLPHRSEFQPVVCHDLSVKGISFFAERPLADLVVVSIGDLDNPKWILSRVCHARAVAGTGAPRYLVGCEFIRRIHLEQHDRKPTTSHREAVAVERC